MVSNRHQPAAHLKDPAKGASLAAATQRGRGIEASTTDAHTVMTSAEVGRLLQVSQATLCRWRQRGIGPRVLWLSARVPRYLRTDVQQWIEPARS